MLASIPWTSSSSPPPHLLLLLLLLLLSTFHPGSVLLVSLAQFTWSLFPRLCNLDVFVVTSYTDSVSYFLLICSYYDLVTNSGDDTWTKVHSTHLYMRCVTYFWRKDVLAIWSMEDVFVCVCVHDGCRILYLMQSLCDCKMSMQERRNDILMIISNLRLVRYVLRPSAGTRHWLMFSSKCCEVDS